MFEQHFKLGIQFGGSLAFGNGAYDNAKVFWLYAVYKLLKTGSFLASFYL